MFKNLVMIELQTIKKIIRQSRDINWKIIKDRNIVVRPKDSSRCFIKSIWFTWNSKEEKIMCYPVYFAELSSGD